MTLDAETLEILKTVGPYILSGVGLLLTSVFSAIAWVGRILWKAHQKRMKLMAQALTDLSKGLKDYREEAEREHGRLKDALVELRSELRLSNANWTNTKESLLKVEGALEAQVKRVDSYIEKMGVMQAMFVKVFEFIDAKKRATDIAPSGA